MQSLRIDIHACPSLYELQARERRVLLVQVMPDCLLFVHPFSFVVVDFLSLSLSLFLSLSLSVFREETTLPARPQEHMFTNNKSRRMLLKNQQTERITPPRFDRHSLNWFILSCCPTDAIRFLFSVSSGCRTVEGCLVTVYIVCPRLNNFIPLYKWGIKSNDI